MSVRVEVSKGIQVGEGQKLLLIAGPCQIESLEHCRKIATFLKEQAQRLELNLVFKASFDKANRTSQQGVRGIGVEAGLEILRSIRKEFSLPVLTDIHLPEQAALAADCVDILQIPAFLCRQTDLLIAAGKTGLAVHIKKGQFLHPADMAHAAEKVASTGNQRILLCERGSCFGYRELIVDMRSLLIMRGLGYPVVFDATHSVQLMGGGGGKSSGSREFIAPLVRAAMATGIDGLFLECHDNPDKAPSDGPNMLPLEALPGVLESALRIRAALTQNLATR